jgi:HK97 gp10 family phage protein
VAGKVTIKGLDELHAKLKRLPEILERAGARAVRAEVHEVAQDMRRDAPVLTGELKDGIQEEYDEATVTGKAVSTARHTQFVVHGTSDTPANDFMTPAATRARKRFPKRVTAEINREIGKIT